VLPQPVLRQSAYGLGYQQKVRPKRHNLVHQDLPPTVTGRIYAFALFSWPADAKMREHNIPPGHKTEVNCFNPPGGILLGGPRSSL